MHPQSHQRLGSYIHTTAGGETVRAFVPPPLPPQPPVQLDSMQRLLEDANHAVGRLDGLGSMLPDLSQFIYAYVRKEAVLSAQIEGTQSSYSDLLLFEIDESPGTPVHDVEQASNYVAALNHGLARLRGGFPLSLRLIKEIHAILLRDGRGSAKDPGEFRKSQNWIGGTRPGNAFFVPPPQDHLQECLSQFEVFLHEEQPNLPILVKAGLMHVQFETIHPFLDGNGRLGRLLITFLLCATGVLKEPLLYLSLYLKAHRNRYYDLLTQVRTTGDWETWIEFFLTGVRDTSDQAVKTAKEILALFERDRATIQTLGALSNSASRVHQHAQRQPLLTLSDTAKRTGLGFPAVSRAVERLEKAGIMKEITGRQRGRVYVYTDYLDILKEGTEPLPRG